MLYEILSDNSTQALWDAICMESVPYCLAMMRVHVQHRGWLACDLYRTCIPYSRKNWRSLNLAVWPQTECKKYWWNLNNDFNLVVSTQTDKPPNLTPRQTFQLDGMPSTGIACAMHRTCIWLAQVLQVCIYITYMWLAHQLTYLPCKDLKLEALNCCLLPVHHYYSYDDHQNKEYYNKNESSSHRTSNNGGRNWRRCFLGRSCFRCWGIWWGHRVRGL